ncbi:metal ABC transporter solute-binding protein, Zn/Mn family [Lacticaseibacillus baoqingensis]|uniref:Metal ABC transporter solute-binding protein, Zn/Mn family n=1 Tax=Lacticaseibacillus baoqingensis TaxID=2486013 RepID=A0ABW4E3M6_9LACO|nr:zinc ABC transporter substrate-binding protein [Lacticaseibacillus baoqingensis]
MRKRLWWGVWLFVLLSLSGCGQRPAQSDGQLNVVTSVDFYAEVANAVVGKYGHVASVINDPAVDPHDYEPTVATGKMVAKSDLVLTNGAGYDSWMTKLTRAEPHVAVVSAAKVVGIHDGENEHIWYQPTAMPKLALALAKRLGQIDPKHRAAFTANAKQYIQHLQPLQRQIEQLKADRTRTAVAVSEPVFNNALTYLGYHVANEHFAAAVEEGTDPSPTDIRALNTQMKTGQLAFFVLNTQVDSKIVTNAVATAKQNHVPILKVTETLPKGLTYTSWMLKQYRALAKIQAGE